MSSTIKVDELNKSRKQHQQQQQQEVIQQHMMINMKTDQRMLQ